MNGFSWQPSEKARKISSMITHCHECDTYFRVSVDQIKAANGQVKCGCCMTVFNAIDSLLENQDVQASALLPFTEQSTETDDLEIGTASGSALLASDVDLPDESIVTKISLENATEEDLNWPDTSFLTTQNDHDAQPESDQLANDTAISSDTKKAEAPEETESFPFPHIQDPTFDIEELDLDLIEKTIDEEQPEKTNSLSFFWTATMLLLLGLLGVQFAQYNASNLITQYPQLSPLCNVLDCPVEQASNDATTIQLISRDVREHPQFQDILLVNAILMNRDIEQQAFPSLQLDLFDNVGRPVGSRIFKPQEYLDSSVDIQRGMQPELPVHVVLEVVGNGSQTSSFEFNFL